MASNIKARYLQKIQYTTSGIMNFYYFPVMKFNWKNFSFNGPTFPLSDL
jgi:hypothetical protein